MMKMNKRITNEVDFVLGKAAGKARYFSPSITLYEWPEYGTRKFMCSFEVELGTPWFMYPKESLNKLLVSAYSSCKYLIHAPQEELPLYINSPYSEFVSVLLERGTSKNLSLSRLVGNREYSSGISM